MSREAVLLAIEAVRTLPDRLDADPTILDEAIVQAVDHLNAQMETNCVSWAEGMFAATAPLCRRRPHLAPALLRHAFLSLVYLGHESFEHTQQFVRWLLEQPTTYLMPLREDGREWLTENYHELAPSLQPVMVELVRLAQQES